MGWAASNSDEGHSNLVSRRWCAAAFPCTQNDEHNDGVDKGCWFFQEEALRAQRWSSGGDPLCLACSQEYRREVHQRLGHAFCSEACLREFLWVPSGPETFDAPASTSLRPPTVLPLVCELYTSDPHDARNIVGTYQREAPDWCGQEPAVRLGEGHLCPVWP